MSGPSNPLRPSSSRGGQPVHTRRPSSIRRDKHVSCSYPLTGQQFDNLKGDHDDFNALFGASLSQARKFMGTGFKYCILASKVTSLTAVDNLLKRYGKKGTGCAKIAGGSTKAEKAHAQGMCKVFVDYLKTERQRLAPYKPQPHKFKWDWNEWFFTFSIFGVLALIGYLLHKTFGDGRPPPPADGPKGKPDPKPKPKPKPKRKPKPKPKDKPDPNKRVWDDPEFYPIYFPKPDPIDVFTSVDTLEDSPIGWEDPHYVPIPAPDISLRNLGWGVLGVLAGAAAVVAFVVPVDGPLGETALAGASAFCFAQIGKDSD